MKIEDKVGFGHGDIITQASVLRPHRGGRYISAFFVIKRGATSLSDFFISGAGALRTKEGLSDQYIHVIAEDFKASSAEMPLGAVWEDVPIPDGQSIGKQLDALRLAGVPLRYEVTES